MSIAAPASPTAGWLSRPAGSPWRPLVLSRRARERRRRNIIIGSAVGGLAVVLLGLYLYFFTQLIKGAVGPSTQPQSVSRAVLEALPNDRGTGLFFVLIDASGQDAAFRGSLSVSLREPDGAVYHTTRSVTPQDFRILPSGSLLEGRLGYEVDIPPSAWSTPPRRGNPALIVLGIAPVDGPPISYTGNEIFP